jgi:uroporphyrin-III C-methyltransferase/precorrin-2 dehydrogenase/sirohydrochlorin ferrochelatase
MEPQAEPLLPLSLKLAGRDVLVVGAGAMGAMRVGQLADAGARVTVVAPDVRPEAAARASAVRRRAFRPEDVDGMWLAIAAAPPEVNRAVSAAAEARRVFVNAVDDPQSASVYFPGVVRKGGATIAVSTDGRAPALAGLLREGIEAVLPDDLGTWRDLAAGLRDEWKARKVPLAQRRPLLLEKLNALYAARGARQDGEG